MARLDGKVAVVTGGAQGIGAAYCKALAREGAKVCIADIADGTPVARIIEQAGGEAIAVPCDVTVEDDNRRMVAETVQAFGHLDILIANAGLYTHLERMKATERTVEDWDRVMAVNVKGVWLSAKAAIPEMQKNGYGKIINIASSVSFKGAPGLTHYGASKAAVVGITRSMAQEFGEDGICINAIAPGPTETETGRAVETEEMRARRAKSAQTRAIKRTGQPEDLVGLCVFLASPESDFMTGQTVVVDGGGIMW
ncbi:MAG: 3-oxoacyl-ACP reductase family protein [Alphaproteobacteria bacterium]|nr:3-oxoacyl-ACP reductase family protein [Alphaproteobacteria bacterium]